MDSECGLKAYTIRSRKAMTSLKLDQFVGEAICDKYVVELSLGDLLKVSCSWRRKPWPIYDNLLHQLSRIGRGLKHPHTLELKSTHSLDRLH